MSANYKVTIIDTSELDSTSIAGMREKILLPNPTSGSEINLPVNDSQKITPRPLGDLSTYNHFVGNRPMFKRLEMKMNYKIVSTGKNAEDPIRSFIIDEDDEDLLVIQVDESNDEVSVDCFSTRWQPYKVEMVPSNEANVKHIVVEGTLDHIVNIDPLLRTTTDPNEIDTLIEVFRMKNDKLQKLLVE